MEAVVLAWVVTYLLHSTILVLGAWLLERRWGDRPERMSGVWKTALVGGLLTASLQTGLGVSPAAGQWSLDPGDVPSPGPSLTAGADALPAPAVEPVVAASVVEAEPGPIGLATRSWPPTDEAAALVSYGSWSPRGEPGGAETEPVPVALASPTVVAPAAAVPAAAVSWWVGARAWIVGLLGLGALLGLGSVGLAYVALRGQLQGRRALREGSMPRLLEGLRARAGVERPIPLMLASRVRMPMAVGVVRPEIVVPPQVAAQLSVPHQESLLAHELAHVLRRDPMWRLVALCMERVLFFQPLNRLASRRVSQAAEYLCDDWAARNTRQPLALASCLTEIATWIAHPGPVVATMAGPRSILGRRVQRLLAPASRRTPPRWHAVALGLPLLAMVLAAPGVSAQAAGDDPEALTIVMVDEDGQRHELVVRDGQVAWSDADGDGSHGGAGSGAPDHDPGLAPAQSRKEARAEARAADKARRRARKDLRRAFRDAKRRGDVAPSEREVRAILDRSRAQVPSRAPSPPVPGEGAEGLQLHVVVPGKLELHGRVSAELGRLEALEALEALDGLDEEIGDELERELGPVLELLEGLEGLEGGDGEVDVVLRTQDGASSVRVRVRPRARAQGHRGGAEPEWVARAEADAERQHDAAQAHQREAERARAKAARALGRSRASRARTRALLRGQEQRLREAELRERRRERGPVDGPGAQPPVVRLHLPDVPPPPRVGSPALPPSPAASWWAPQAPPLPEAPGSGRAPPAPAPPAAPAPEPPASAMVKASPKRPPAPPRALPSPRATPRPVPTPVPVAEESPVVWISWPPPAAPQAPRAVARRRA